MDANKSRAHRFALIALGAAATLAAGWLWLPDGPPSTEPTATAVELAAIQHSGDVRLEGEIRSTENLSIADADVCVYGNEPSNRLIQHCARSNGRGEYFIQLKPGAYQVVVTASDFGSKTDTLVIASDALQRRDFMLDKRPPNIAGAVKSATGTVISHAQVALFAGAEPVANIFTDDKGAFAAWAPDGLLTVRVSASGFGSALVYAVVPSFDVDVTLFPGNSVLGRVLHEGTLQAVPNVRVMASDRNDGRSDPSRHSAAVTDQDGRFLFENLASGEWYFSVAESGLWGTTPQPVLVASQTPEVEVVVSPAGELSGKFVIEDGEVCSHGELQVIPSSMFRGVRSAQDSPAVVSGPALKTIPVLKANVESDGTVRLPAIPHGSYLIGAKCTEHELAGGPAELEIGNDAATNQEWKFRTGNRVAVYVTDDAGRPVANAVVSASLESEIPLTPAQTIRSQRAGSTDAQGRYEFGGLPRGRYQVSARYGGINGTESVVESVEVGVAKIATARLVLPGSGLIRIHAQGADGKAVSRVLFFAMDQKDVRYEATYRGGGLSIIGPVPRNSYRVYAYDNKNPKILLNDGNPVTVLGSEPVDVEYRHRPATGKLEGRVVDSGGAPVPGVLLRAVSTSLDENDALFAQLQYMMHGAQIQMTDPSGHFRVDGLSTQTAYDLYLEHPSGMKVRRKNVAAGAFVQVELPATATITGRVVDKNGMPVTDFSIAVSSVEENEERVRTFSHADGRFTIDDLRTGNVRLTVSNREGEQTADFQTMLAAGQTANAGTLVLRTEVDEGS